MNINPLKVLILTTTFPPRGGSSVQRVSKFVKYLPSYNFSVTVLTCSETGLSVPDATLLKDIPRNTEVIRTPKRPGGKVGGSDLSSKAEIVQEKPVANAASKRRFRFKKILYPDEYALWALGSVKKGIKRLKKGDVDLIFSSFGSPTTLFLGYYLSRKYSLPWIVDVRDFWSLNEMKFQYTQRIFPINLLDRFFDRFFMRRAHRITVVSDCYKEELVEKFRIKSEKITVIYNGYDDDDFKDVLRRKNKSSFTIRYVGFLMKEQRIDAFLEALKECISEFIEDEIVLEFVGGSNNTYIDQQVEKHSLSNNTKIIGYQPHAQAVSLMVDADLLLIIPGMGKGTITGKIFEYIRSGTPVLMLDQDNRDAKNILSKSGRGVAVSASDKDEIKYALKCVYDEWKSSQDKGDPVSKKMNEFTKSLSRYELTGKLAKVFDSLIQEAGQR